MWTSDFLMTARTAARRALADLQGNSPLLADRASKWLASRCNLDQPESYFIHPQAVPILALPWWLETSIRGCADPTFQTDLMYSTINGYYFTRIVDDLMDGHYVDHAVLPSLYFFIMKFQCIYYKYFSRTDLFWSEFERLLLETAVSAAADCALEDVGEKAFVQISARKSAAGAIPMAAVCYRYNRPELLVPWEGFFRRFGCWHQMRDDLADWSDDSENGRQTWLLSEAQRQRAVNESIPAWMGHAGFQWAFEKMEEWMEEMLAAGEGLSSPELINYLSERRESCRREITALVNMAAAYARVLQLDHIS